MTKDEIQKVISEATGLTIEVIEKATQDGVRHGRTTHHMRQHFKRVALQAGNILTFKREADGSYGASWEPDTMSEG
jgi:hypothetical protein